MKHDWQDRFNLTCCRACGVVRQADGATDQKRCPGTVRVKPRVRVKATNWTPRPTWPTRKYG